MAKPCRKFALNVPHQHLASRPVAGPGPEIPQWIAVYTFPKHERAVAERLTGSAVEVFYPSLMRQSQWKDRRTWIQRPLFPGYVFVRVPLDDRLAVLRVPGVIRIISCKAVPLAIPDSDIEAVRLCLLAPGKVESHPYVESGMRVRLTSGPCAGVEGVVSQSDDGCKLIVAVPAIQQAVALDVDASGLEPVHPSFLQ